ncbi:MAG: hypothetical protein IT537_08605 [Hyphomicrobiales bacterium]|nr:hypothetical protein [Hyphomicrobiales bacterium]
MNLRHATHSDLLAYRKRLMARIEQAKAKRESVAELQAMLKATTTRLLAMEWKQERRKAAA